MFEAVIRCKTKFCAQKGDLVLGESDVVSRARIQRMACPKNAAADSAYAMQPHLISNIQ